MLIRNLWLRIALFDNFFLENSLAILSVFEKELVYYV